MVGAGAAAFLEWTCANRVARAVGSITYTAMLNSGGGIEGDVTVSRLGPEHFMIVTGTAFGRHDLSWIEQHLPGDGSVVVRDVTSSMAAFALWGPAARDVLASVCDDDLSFGYMRARRITVGDVACWALRVTYVGELGWELYPASEYGLRLWDTLVAAGGPHGLVPGGYRAIDSMRLEKGYAAWAADITSQTDPYAAGLGFAVRDDKEFFGRSALAARDPSAPRLATLVLDDNRAVAYGNEPVRTPDGAVVGRVSSGGLGYFLDVSIALAWLEAGHNPTGNRLTVEVFGREVGAVVTAQPLHDPTGSRLRV